MVASMKELLEAGVHFGHQVKRWNPKMKKYIFGERNGIYIIDLQKTLKGLEDAYYYVRDIASSGAGVLFVGMSGTLHLQVQGCFLWAPRNRPRNLLRKKRRRHPPFMLIRDGSAECLQTLLL
jgi:hypothetical protein